MKLPAVSILASALVLLAVQSPAADRAAADLIAKIEESQRTDGAVIRAKLTVENTKSGDSSSAQIRIRLRHDANATRLLYQVLWPAAHKGEAVSIERTPKGRVSGFIFTPPGTAAPLNAAAMGRAWLGSNLSIEDLAEDFWQWPSQRISGEETISGEPCKIIESRPPSDARAGYPLVRSWISPAKLVPLRIEKFGQDGRLAKRFTVLRTSRRDGKWVPVTTVVQSPGSAVQTTLELSRGERDVEIPVEEFSIERVSRP